MQIDNGKATFGTIWAVTMGAAAFAGTLSPSSWTLLAVLTLFPTLILVKLTSSPPQTLSQNIQEVLR